MQIFLWIFLGLSLVMSLFVWCCAVVAKRSDEAMEEYFAGRPKGDCFAAEEEND